MDMFDKVIVTIVVGGIIAITAAVIIDNKNYNDCKERGGTLVKVKQDGYMCVKIEEIKMEDN